MSEATRRRMLATVAALLIGESAHAAPAPVPQLMVELGSVELLQGEGQLPLGAVVLSLSSIGAAYKAGVRTGDIILRFGEHDISSPEQLQSFVKSSVPGSEVAVEVLRKGQKMGFVVRFKE